MITHALVAAAFLHLAFTGPAGPPDGSRADRAPVSVTTVDFLKGAGLSVNGAGPILVKVDAFRNRLVVANTLSSSVSIIAGDDRSVANVPLEGRALQHLKAEALALSAKTGDAYLVGARCFSIVSPDAGSSRTIRTGVQFESIAVDEATGNVFIAGRESAELGFYDAKSRKLRLIPWLETREDLINLNATPPPPIRKVIAAPELNWIVAVDGFTSTLFLFDGRNGKLLNSRPLKLTSGGRWHLAGYDGETHRLYLVVETAARKVIEAARIDVLTGDCAVVPLPQYTEAVGVVYNPARGEVYIPYDNHASVHVVDFAGTGSVHEIRIPAYGNDGSAVDTKGGILYIASWAHGEVDVIDLAERRLVKRITGLGIIPHMFTLVFDPGANLLYFPKGATAVNGAFGAALTALDPVTEKTEKIYTGWAPIDLVEVPSRGSFLVFNSEDEFAEVRPDGAFETHRLPFDYPVEAALTPGGNVYLSYGPHQSYWPVVYIWGAKNGILGIDAKDLGFYDRRIPRQAHRMVFDAAGTLYFTQNLWGKEGQMIGTLGDEVRLFEIGARIAIPDTIERETTQRILRYDPGKNLLYLVRVAEKDGDPGILHVVDPVSRKDIAKIPVGRSPADLAFDDTSVYVANFDSKTVSVVDKTSFAVREVATESEPLKLCRWKDRIYVLSHAGGSLQEVRPGGAVHRVPFEGPGDNCFEWGDGIVVTSHNGAALSIAKFSPATGKFATLHRMKYPYGDTRFDSRNVSFYLSGQFGDAVFSITNGKTAADGRLWITDFLSGKLFILKAD